MSFDISVIIPTFNDAEYLQRALISVINQVVKPVEIIVIDDGSINNNAKLVVDEVSSQLSTQILYIWKENGGASSARNYGIENATGEYIAFLDADDEWLSNHLEVKVNKLKKLDAEYFGVYSGFINYPTCVESTFSSVSGVVNPDSIGKKNGFPGGAPSYLFRRDKLVELGGFDHTLKQNEDFDLLLRLIKSGYKFEGDNEITFIRHLRAGSLTRNNNYFLSYKRVNAFLYKAWILKYLSRLEIIKRGFLNVLFFSRRIISL